MPTIREVKTELRHREWAEQIQECQSSGARKKVSASTHTTHA